MIRANARYRIVAPETPRGLARAAIAVAAEEAPIVADVVVPYRLYLILRLGAEFPAKPRQAEASPEEIEIFIEKELLPALGLEDSVVKALRIASIPTLNWKLEVEGEHDKAPPPARLVVSFAQRHGEEVDALEALERAARAAMGKPLPRGILIDGVGDDPGGDNADHWCPGGADRRLFGDRAAARAALRLGRLREEGLTGRGVNVVIVDDGLCRSLLGANWGGGLSNGKVMPGTAPPDSHGMMVARNVLDAAPQAVLYDVPLIPSRIVDIPVFVSDAQAVFELLQLWIEFLRHWPRWAGPWIFVNAWAIFDRASERSLGSYTQNKSPGGHPFNNLVGDIVAASRIDMAFAAGNCGQFCPSRRCGPVDRGPRHSIWGANSHDAVITAGAARSDGLWLGYSSQGPGQPLLATEKPDLCTPSDFAETTDAAYGNTGTSAAAGLAAGVVAALRSNPRWDAANVPPSALKQELTDTARDIAGTGWNGRLGHGMLDAAAAFEALSLDFP
jgi:hypothetical protein